MLAESGVLVQAGVDFDVVAFSNCVHSWAQGSLPTNKFLTAPDACPARNQSVQVGAISAPCQLPDTAPCLPPVHLLLSLLMCGFSTLCLLMAPPRVVLCALLWDHPTSAQLRVLEF